MNSAGWRSALYQAWFATALEQTKSIFTLSSAGVGLATTLLFNEKTRPIASWAPVWLLLSAASFGLTALACLHIFRLNKSLTESLVRYESFEKLDQRVGRFDLTARLTFFAALAFLIFAAIAQIWL